MKRPVDLPKMFQVSLRVRCDCDKGEILTESIMLPWETPSEHVAYLVQNSLKRMKLEAEQHLTDQKK